MSFQDNPSFIFYLNEKLIKHWYCKKSFMIIDWVCFHSDHQWMVSIMSSQAFKQLIYTSFIVVLWQFHFCCHSNVTVLLEFMWWHQLPECRYTVQWGISKHWMIGSGVVSEEGWCCLLGQHAASAVGSRALGQFRRKVCVVSNWGKWGVTGVGMWWVAADGGVTEYVMVVGRGYLLLNTLA